MSLSAPPPLLYRYRPASGQNFDRLRKMIVEGEHYFATPGSLNDPFDCRPIYRLGSSDNAVRQYLQYLFSKFEPNVPEKERSAQIEQLLTNPDNDPRRQENQQLLAAAISFGINRIGVLCLSASDRVPLMWAHYAESNSGVCLGFDSSMQPLARALPVQYSNTRPIVDLTVDTYKSELVKTLYSKSDDWCYEQEWRLCDDLRGPGIHFIPTSALRQIILGFKAPHDLLREVLAWARDFPNPIEIYRVRKSMTSFEFEIQRYK